MPPALLVLRTIQETLEWYERNLCRIELRDPRGHRVRFQPENFIHLIQLKNKYGEEPRNSHLALEEIKAGKIQFVAGRFDAQRTVELSWAAELATNPDRICGNWQALGRGDETYIRQFGTDEALKVRVMVCKVIGTTRQVVTIFPRDRIKDKDCLAQIWP